MSLTQVLDFMEARQKVHVPIESPTVARGVADYLRGVSDEELLRCCDGHRVPWATAQAACEERARRNASRPQRIQRSRAKDFNLQAAATNGLPVVYVGRPTRWGNPYDWRAYRERPSGLGGVVRLGEDGARLAAIMDYRRDVISKLNADPEYLAPLRGKNLACWCAVGQRCHVDTLLELANR